MRLSTTHALSSWMLSAALLSSLALMALPMDAQASWGRSKKATDEQRQQEQTQEFVDARMHETMTSIDGSLNTLVKLTQGGQPLRQAPPIGATVAGAAGPARPAFVPDAVPLSTTALLQQNVSIHWDGSAVDLLQNLAQQLGMTYNTSYVRSMSASSKKAASKKLHVRLDGQRMSVQDVLASVARQIDQKADVHVALADKAITLQVR